MESNGFCNIFTQSSGITDLGMGEFWYDTMPAMLFGFLNGKARTLLFLKEENIM